MKKRRTFTLPPGAKKAGAWLKWPLLGFLLCAGQVAGLYAPFALAAVSIAGVRLPGLAAVTGVAGGALVFLDFQSGLRCTAAAILIFAANTALYDLPAYKKPYFRPLCTAGFFLLVQSIYLLGRSGQSWLLALCAAAAAAGAAWLPAAKQEKWGYLCGLALAAVSVSAFGFSVGRALMMALLLTICRGCSVSQCVALGGCLGLLVDLTAAEPTVFYALVFGAGGAAGGLARRLPRLPMGICAAGVCGALGLLFGQDALPITLWESLAGAVLYAALPEKLLPKLYVSGKRSEGAPQSTPYARPAAALRALYDSFFRGEQPQPPENPSVLFDRAAQEVCSTCVLRADCWQSHYSDTYSAFNDACPKLLRRGRAEAADFPLHFSSRCVHFPALLQAIDRQTHDYLLRQQFHRQLQEARDSAREQYACFSELLDQAAMPVSSQNRIGYRVSSSLRPRAGERLCGDQVDSFEVGDGVYLLLCDGMGSGQEAHREAAMTVRLLRQFLEAGIRPGPALKTLNAAMKLRCQTSGGFSTVDLAVMQRQSGCVELYKCGAAPSYLKRGGSVRRLYSDAPPAGLSDSPLPPDQVKIPVQAGDFLVLISDGIADRSCDEWLLNLLAGWNGSSADELTTLILSESRCRKGLADDCAVAVLHLPTAAENQKTAV